MREVKAVVSMLLDESSTLSDGAVRNLLRQSLRDHWGNPTKVMDPCGCQEHEDHGRGTEEDGPDDSDCPCRETEKQTQCALSGCGFCRSVEILKAHG